MNTVADNGQYTAAQNGECLSPGESLPEAFNDIEVIGVGGLMGVMTGETRSHRILDELIREFVRERERVNALKQSLPNELSPAAISAYEGLFSRPFGSAIGLRYALQEAVEKLDIDIDRLCAFRRSLPERFASSDADEGLALILKHFIY